MRIDTDRRARTGSVPSPSAAALMQIRDRMREGAIRFLPGLTPVGLASVPVASAPASPPLGRLGSLEVRLAATAKEVRRAQRLRFKVFYEERAAVPGPGARLSRRDVDAYDPFCRHLLVLDHDVAPKPFRAHRPKVVGTYRLMTGEAASRAGGFYAAGEFDLAPLLAAHRGANFLELGRSCVLKPYRNRRTVELLWQGIWAFVLANDVDAMIGCASLEGTDPGALALPLAFLHHHAGSPEAWRVRARPERRVAMDRLARHEVDPKAAMKALPPLIKGYLRVGATFGDGAVVDRQFGTTDVFVVQPTAAVNSRYIDHFGPSANRYAA